MPTIFEDNLGNIVSIRDPSVSALMRPLIKTGPDVGPISIPSRRSLITRVTTAQQGNFQFMHTLGSDIYVYVFGDRIGQMVVSGMSFPRSCEGSANSNLHGLELMLDWYNEHKISARRTPLQMSIGSVVFTSFVIGMTTDVLDPNTRVTQYNLNLLIVPERPPQGSGARTGLLGAGSFTDLA